MQPRHVGAPHIHDASRADDGQDMGLQDPPVFGDGARFALGCGVKGKEIIGDRLEGPHLARGPTLGNRIGTSLYDAEQLLCF